MNSIEMIVMEARELSRKGDYDEAIELLIPIHEISGELIKKLKIKQAQKEFSEVE